MLGIKEHTAIITGKFAAAVRKAAKDSVVANSKQASQKKAREKRSIISIGNNDLICDVWYGSGV